jgi:uncharacterized protein (DUF362 family)
MTDCHATIAGVTDYEDVEAIRRFVRAALAHDEEVRGLLTAATADRLVVVKPNWVQESHEYRPDVWLPLITHPVLILVLVEELATMMDGRGTIALCDAPHTYASFDAIIARGRLGDLLTDVRRRYPGLNLELLDLRREVWVRKEEVVVDRVPNPPDPRGYVGYDLGGNSLFAGHAAEGRYYGADYDTGVVNRHHHGSVHEYLLARTPVDADLFINVPKLKTHKKTGITCCLKNLVGINGDKNWLPHHAQGSPRDGGDEFPDDSLSNRIERTVKRIGHRMALSVPGLGTWALRRMRGAGKRLLGDSETTVRNGNWWGNDTCWRMALDLNRALLYGTSDGNMRDAGRRAYLAIVDGIIGGEGNGPLCPDPVRSGVLLSGTDPAVVDAVGARLIGYDPMAFPIVRNAFADHRWPIGGVEHDAIRIRDGRAEDRPISIRDLEPAIAAGFRLHFGWSDWGARARVGAPDPEHDHG